jgi:hypothetical protein
LAVLIFQYISFLYISPLKSIFLLVKSH